MDRRFAGVAIAVTLVAGSFVTAAAGTAGGTADRPSADDFLTAAGKMGPRPSTLLVAGMRAPDEDDSVKVNAKITCGDEHNGDHLYIHWGDLQYKALTMENTGCSGEDDSGFASGEGVPGTCNGMIAFAEFSFSTEEPVIVPGPDLSRSALKQGGTATVDVDGGPMCQIHGEPPFQGSIKFHDQTKDEEEPPPSTR